MIESSQQSHINLTGDLPKDAYSVDPRSLCPINNEVCPARVNLIGLYEGAIPKEVADTIIPECDPKYDSAKLSLKLAEMTVAAQVSRCAGVENNVCPTRESMDTSYTRKITLKGLRRIFGKG